MPPFLDWIARPFGRHTAAALLHDQLITNITERLPEATARRSRRGRFVFRDAMLDCGARILQTWIMWAGVTLRTRVHRNALVTLGIGLWFLCRARGHGAARLGIVTTQLLPVLVALVAPIPFALLWGRQWSAGLIAGYSFWIVVLGFMPSWVAYQLYRVAELHRAARRPPSARRAPKAGEARRRRPFAKR